MRSTMAALTADDLDPEMLDACRVAVRAERDQAEALAVEVFVLPVDRRLLDLARRQVRTLTFLLAVLDALEDHDLGHAIELFASAVSTKGPTT